jgi:hypothetical protein
MYVSLTAEDQATVIDVVRGAVLAHAGVGAPA